MKCDIPDWVHAKAWSFSIAKDNKYNGMVAYNNITTVAPPEKRQYNTYVGTIGEMCLALMLKIAGPDLTVHGHSDDVDLVYKGIGIDVVTTKKPCHWILQDPASDPAFPRLKGLVTVQMLVDMDNNTAETVKGCWNTTWLSSGAERVAGKDCFSVLHVQCMSVEQLVAEMDAKAGANICLAVP